MSQSEVERFVEALQSDPALLAEVREHATLAPIVALAGERGYRFTADELRTAMAPRKLTTAELDATAGGNSIGDIWNKLVPQVRY